VRDGAFASAHGSQGGTFVRGGPHGHGARVTPDGPVLAPPRTESLLHDRSDAARDRVLAAQRRVQANARNVHGIPVPRDSQPVVRDHHQHLLHTGQRPIALGRPVQRPAVHRSLGQVDASPGQRRSRYDETPVRETGTGDGPLRSVQAVGGGCEYRQDADPMSPRWQRRLRIQTRPFHHVAAAYHVLGRFGSVASDPLQPTLEREQVHQDG